jgi:lipopolysaccharide transport system permease protein
MTQLRKLVIAPGLTERHYWSDLWRYRELFYVLAWRDVSVRYKQTLIGLFWALLRPFVTMVIFTVIFSKIANLKSEGAAPYALMVYAGLLPWQFFSSALLDASNSLYNNSNLIGKVYFPRLVMPISSVMSNMVKFGIQFILLLVVMAWFGMEQHYFYMGSSWLLIPLLVVMMAGMGLGLGIIISSLTTKYRDFTVLIGFAVQLLMYATPIAYPLSFLKTKSFASWFTWNPLTPIVEAFRYSLFGTGTMDSFGLLYSGAFILVTLLLGMVFFSKVERTFMDTV